MSDHVWSGSTPVFTHCHHGLDLRLNPRCYLCTPAAQPDEALQDEVRALREAVVAVLDSDALDPDDLTWLYQICRKAIGTDWPYLDAALDRLDR